MTVNEPTEKLNIFARDPNCLETVRSSEMARNLFSRQENALICVDKHTTSNVSLEQSSTPLPKRVSFSRVLILFTELPVKTSTIEAWKLWVFNNNISEYRMDFLRIGDFTKHYLEGRILRHCRNWEKERPEWEGAPDERWQHIGGLLDLSGSNGDNTNSLAADSPEFLTATLGSMGELMLRVHDVYKRFAKTMNDINVDAEKKAYKFDIGKRSTEIAGFLQSPDVKHKVLESDKWPVSFPKLLLYGETGVGKSLVSRYLHKLVSGKGRPLRISIPEFVGKEDYFEYALFGYAKGTFTGGLANGSTGLLIENMGNVVFLDEIEEANNIIQAKLLAFMDDYRVRPRGWLQQEAFYCPVLIVAATNCSVEELQERHFRKDLLARFTDIETIPPLRERRESTSPPRRTQVRCPCCRWSAR